MSFFVTTFAADLKSSMKIAILGGSGFVGTRLIEILKDNHEIVNIDLVNSPFFPQLTKTGDVRIPAQMNEMLKGAEVVILLAAQHRDDVTPSSLYYDTNVNGMKVVLDAMEKNGIKRFVFFSSLAIYGLPKILPPTRSITTESRSGRPNSCFGNGSPRTPT